MLFLNFRKKLNIFSTNSLSIKMAFMNNQRFPYCEEKEEWFMYKEQRKNPKFFKDVTAKQVNIVGSESLLERLHSNLEQGKVDPFFYKETLDLYKWRLGKHTKSLKFNYYSIVTLFIFFGSELSRCDLLTLADYSSFLYNYMQYC